MIHYHGLPISGALSEQTEFSKGKHVLIPFTSRNTIQWVADTCSTFCLDNGAFTMWRGGKTPDWDAYISWVEEWSQHPSYDFAIYPDVICGSEEQNKRLLLKYYGAIKNGVPVYHLHESLDYADRLCNMFGRVSIGSSGEWPTPGTAGWWGRMTDVMKVMCNADGVPRVKLHGLRMLNPKLCKLPLSSADSCNAGINAGSKKRFGMYLPNSASDRAKVIASRIESINFASRWEP